MPEAPPAMSPAEQAANAKRLEAEGRKFDAEAREAEAKARTAAANAIKHEIDSVKAVEADNERRAADDFHHIYRFDGEVTTSSVSNCMDKLTTWHRLDPDCDIEVIFSSPGGSIFDGMELFDFLVDLQNRGHKVITGGTGMAASMAGILVQAGNPRWVSHECWFLIHRAAFIAMGKTYDVEDRVELIKRIEDRIIDIFVSRSGGKLTKRRIRRNWERKDWWHSSDECLELGLIDEIRGRPMLGDDDE